MKPHTNGTSKNIMVFSALANCTLELFFETALIQFPAQPRITQLKDSSKTTPSYHPVLLHLKMADIYTLN